MTPAPGSPRLAGVIGWPARHSLSPVMHRYWAERAGLDVAYLPLLVEPGCASLSRAVAAVRGVGLIGVNVTLPHKEHALKIADTASDSARAIGAANMLTFRADRIHAHNSDAAGFATAIASMLPTSGEIRALILGAGGAARAVAFALARMLPAKDRAIRLAVSNRTADRAARVAADFGGDVIPWSERSERLAEFNLLVNATSLGMRETPALEIDLAGLPDAAFVADIVYAPLQTPLLRAARARGLRAADGLGMLMWQAVPAFEEWFAAPAPADAALRAHLTAALAREGRA